MAVLTDETARLRERQGAGARYDADAAPARELTWARRGTAYFARKLNELTDDELDGASLIPGWSRRRVIAHVGYQARALSQIVEAVRTGAPYMETPAAERLAQLDQGETLPARALRHLFDHSEVHLNVEWRDLQNADWDKTVTDASGARHDVRQTPIVRAQAVWVHAVDLDNGGSFHDFPPDLLDAMLAGRAASLQNNLGRTGLRLVPTDRPGSGAATGAVSGSAADLVRFASGRGVRRLTGPSEILTSAALRPEPI